jgi:hypothetical protein
MSDNMTLEQYKAKIAELELDVKLATAGQAGRAVAAAAAAAEAAGKQPLMMSAFNRMSPLKRMQVMTAGTHELVDDRDV